MEVDPSHINAIFQVKNESLILKSYHPGHGAQPLAPCLAFVAAVASSFAPVFFRHDFEAGEKPSFRNL